MKNKENHSNNIQYNWKGYILYVLHSHVLRYTRLVQFFSLQIPIFDKPINSLVIYNNLDDHILITDQFLRLFSSRIQYINLVLNCMPPLNQFLEIVLVNCCHVQLPLYRQFEFLAQKKESQNPNWLHKGVPSVNQFVHFSVDLNTALKIVNKSRFSLAIK